jgi:hypothetical protein
MKSGYRFTLVLSVFLLSLAPMVVAQTTGAIEGTVTDQSGGTLPGVTVEITSPNLQGTRTATTGNDGRFRFVSVPPGPYKVTAALSGMGAVQKTATVVLGATATVNMQMQVSAKEAITVTGQAPVIDTTHGAIGTSATIQELEKLPLTRNFTGIASRAPGTGTDQAGGVTVYGATSLENEYIIDGVNTTGIKLGNQGKTLNNEFVQEVEVKLGGYEAEFGRALGGVINVITKSGGNEYHGDLFGYYDDKSLASDDRRETDRLAVGQAAFIAPKRLDIGADVGGYIVKDNLWFFGAYDRVNRDADWNHFSDRTTATTLSGTQEDRTNLYSGKLTWRIGESNTLVGSVFGDPGDTNSQPATLTTPGPDSAILQKVDFGGTDASGRYNGIFGSHFVAEAQFGYHTQKNVLGAQDPAANTKFTHIRSQTGQITDYFPDSGFAGLTLDEKYNRYAYRAAGSWFLSAHELKFGGDYESVQSSFIQSYHGGRVTDQFLASGAYRRTQSRYYGGYPATLNCAQTTSGAKPPAGTYTPLTDCQSYIVGDSFADPDTRNLAFFAQDSWKVIPNLTINAGLRWEQQKLKNAEGVTVIDLNDEWSPRAGVVWDPGNNGRSKVYASFGRFYTTIPQDLQTRSLGRENTVILFNHTRGKFDPLNDQTVLPYAAAQTGDATNPDLKGMYQDEIIAGVQYQILQNWAIGLKGIYKGVGRLVEDRCDLLANPDVRPFGPDSTDPATKILAPTCAIINPGGGGTLNTLKDPTDKNCYPNGAYDEDGFLVPSSPCEGTGTNRIYRGIEFDVSHRFSDHFFIQSSYIYSMLKGNYTGNLSQTREGGQFDPNINADFDYPGILTNAYGLLRNDAEHMFKITGFYAFPFGLTLGGNFTFQSGRPFSIRGCPIDEGACAAGYSQEGYLVQRGSAGRLPDVYEADLHLEYALKLGPVSVVPLVDIFNLINRQGVLSVEELYNNQGTTAGNAPNCGDASDPNAYQNQGCNGKPNSPNANFRKPIAWQTPRFFRVGARISF